MLTLLRLFGRALFGLLFSVEYDGLEHVPADGPVILAGNHPSYLDPVLVGLPLQRPVKFMAWDALFRVPLLGWVIRALGAFPVDIRKGKGEAAFQQALRVLQSGAALGIFPEGQRSEQAEMGELRTGVARLAIETGAPVVPVTIGGASRAWPKWKLLPRSAKLIVRFHPPIRLDEAERAARRDDRDFQRAVMNRIAESINRSLLPAIRGAESLERWYAQPPSHIRSYEWAPLIALLVATIVSWRRGLLASHWPGLVLPALGYYLYLIADLALIPPARLSKWIRNSMPIWLILIWHPWLTEAIAVPAGARNDILRVAMLAAFFPFFYEDYYSLQKFVRGVVASYYFSLALLLGWPHSLGTLVAVLGFITLFAVWYRVIYRAWIAMAMCAAIGWTLWQERTTGPRILLYAGLALATVLYLQAFISLAYDIRKAGNVRKD